jgi:hypothetical protein
MGSKADISLYDWEAEYQQSPVRREGALFRRDLFWPVEVLAQRVRLMGVEANGFQLSGFQELIQDKRLKNLAIFLVRVDSDKVSRSLMVSARAANGKLYYAEGQAGLKSSSPSS